MVEDAAEPKNQAGALMQARELIEEGLREAGAIGNPVARGRHVAAWAFRLSRLEPRRAAELLSRFPEEPALRSRFLATVTGDLWEAGETALQPLFTQAVEEARGLEAESRLRILNSLSETAIALGEREREAAAGLLRQLVPEVRDLHVPPGHPDQPRALGCALVGEALLALECSEEETLLHEAALLAQELPAGDPVLAFVSGALFERDPGWAVELASTLRDPASRLELRLQLAEKTADAALRERLFEEAREDCLQVETMRVPEALVLLGQALIAHDPEKSRSAFEQALAAAGGEQTQLRSLQWTGVAAAIAALDRDWAGRVFQEAAEMAASDEDRGRRATARALIAGEMAASHPREAGALFAQAVEDALGLEALWEYAHLLDVIFRADRSPYLDLAPAAALLERVLALLSDEDPRIPGVFGLPEAGRLMLQLDEDRAAEIFHRWYEASERAGDSDGMTSAAVALFRADAEQGLAALRRTHDFLLRRIDCPAMGEFSRQAAALAPDLVLDLAEQIPDRRERGDALVLAALHLFDRDPERSLGMIRALPNPADRSSALLTLVDRLLHLEDRPYPQPLLEDLP